MDVAKETNDERDLRQVLLQRRDIILDRDLTNKVEKSQEAAVVTQGHIRHQYFYIPRSDERQILESLHEKLSFLQAFLDDYSHKDGETIQSLEAIIRDAAYQAQDIIEWNIYGKIQSSYEGRGVKKGFCQSVLSIIRKKKRLAILNKYYKTALLFAVGQIDLIVKDIQMSCRVEEMQITHTPALASSSQAANSKNEMVGYEEDLIGIQERLCGESSQLKVVPIVGMGGIGKTTFARNIFDDSLTAYHFHTRAWATISQQYRLRGILLGILHSLTLKTEELAGQIQRSYSPDTTDEALIEYVYRSLKGKRYLIVLDDMWSTGAWDDLRMIFPDDNNGSRIVITTRLTNVAEYASSSPIHQMHFLNDDESWNLLHEKVFVEEFCPPELEEIGTIIAKNCGGLPLAIVVVAGILTKIAKTQYHWKTIAENVRAAVATADGNFSKILSLSYDHLPNHLKACFLYMGGFSEDYEIPVSDLIKLWVAEGFLRPIDSESLEATAEECLDDLVKRNLVLMTKKTWTGRFKICSMHDLLRDLCIQKAQEEKFLDVVNSYGGNLANSRRLAICPGIKVVVTNPGELLIRSIFQFNLSWELSSLLLCSKLLRVLHIPNTWLPSFPEEITEMFHLRYLAFTHDNMNGEPLMLLPAISKLQNLQTLIIYRLSTIESSPVPLEIWKIPQLRHLIMIGSKLLIPPAPRNGGRILVLENLQTVSRLMNFEFTSKAIEMIPNVKKLKVMYTSREWSELCLNNLVHLHQLETLNLDLFETGIVRISDAADASIISVPYPVHYGLPISLKKLSLRGCRPPSEDMSLIGSLPNLEVLKLKGFYFVDRRWESKEGEFPRLRFLRIVWSDLMYWRAESTHFPRLEHVILKCCWVLEEIPGEIGDIATLKAIEIDTCSQSAADSALSIQEEQESMGNELLVTILDDFS